jgi:hypothetical protein
LALIAAALAILYLLILVDVRSFCIEGVSPLTNAWVVAGFADISPACSASCSNSLMYWVSWSPFILRLWILILGSLALASFFFRWSLLMMVLIVKEFWPFLVPCVVCWVPGALVVCSSLSSILLIFRTEYGFIYRVISSVGLVVGVIQAMLLVHWLVAGLFLVLRSSHSLVRGMRGAILFLSLRLCSWWSALIQSISHGAFGLFMIHLATISWKLGGSASPMVVSIFVFSS